MSSPRKYASPYLKGLPGLSTSSNSVGGKTRKKSKTLPATKLSESVAAVKHVQDEIWQNVKPVRVCRTASETSQEVVRPERSYDDASLCDGNAGRDITKDPDNEKSQSNAICEETRKHEAADDKPKEIVENEETLPNNGLVSSKDSIVLTHSNFKSNGDLKDEQSCIHDAANDLENEATAIATDAIPTRKSILKNAVMGARGDHRQDVLANNSTKSKKPPNGKARKSDPRIASTWKEAKKREESKNMVSEGKTIESNSSDGIASSKKYAKSPRRRSGARNKPDAVDQPTSNVPKKVVHFSNRIEVHNVPYEPRAGSRACDWQRNMLEQRVQTFRQLMREVGGDEMELYSPMVFPTYSPYSLPHSSNLVARPIGPIVYGRRNP